MRDRPRARSAHSVLWGFVARADILGGMDIPRIAAAARCLLRSADAGDLEADAQGASSLTPFVLSHEARPVLPAGEGRSPGARVRLRVASADASSPVARARVEGALRAPSAAEAARFAAFLPGAALCLEPTSVQVEGSSGAAVLSGADFLLPEPGWKAEEGGILEHMNEDHEDSMLRMCLHYFGHTAASARLLAVDAEGLHVRTDGGTFYFPFDRRCETQEDVHQATVQLARTSRLALASRAG